MAEAPLLMRLVSASVAVADRAGVIIRDIMKKGELGIVEKEGKHDLQTEADRSAQRCIVASLSKQFPKVAIIGEETLDPADVIPAEYLEEGATAEVLSKTCPANMTNVRDEDIVVWVDPVDGTAEYTQGLLDHVTVLIGVAVAGRAVGGVIHQPFYNFKTPGATLGRTIWGIIGVGTYGVEKVLPPAGKRFVTTTRSHPNQTVRDSVAAMHADEVILAGGCGHKAMLVIEGVAHAYVFGSPGCKKWDTCAPEAILHAMGGRLTDMHGNDILYHATVKKPNAGGVLATMSDHDWYVKQVPESVKAALVA
ncbi:PREDICTED: 3'(2'),5'-bisphosphate nucleotidase 1-like [Priapulus caudatus]|uniref:3'(2'),5'-bisphosphate nucleotidase 1 n=1 Tax=Priapulus caudatus TaxID=37621 RepID=A0ABM1ENT8_PRICU|nr:PREDICTED: 3'(2'),5'-bisphosphate nucleotidase 1-like [Priapulus caudatus]XP_014673859.1 PREDICTED: 3'(2'),5'-bisphosphate nucleotidase 1-like [Priapulus caudatus]XP_014673860.1 PREDICTED: 3'(2'),5'-bisphosphate nucleotidase 1-like [Priapulus caudatus]XP_014673861.1 PREDICTED: 3'(2'),5'-bisphosphate nucleotidase 1-like [Priapulus caudatus]